MTAINTTVKADDLKPGKALRLVISGHPIAIVKSKTGTIHALDDKCSHGEISLRTQFRINHFLAITHHGHAWFG